MFDFGAFPTLRTERIDLRALDASFVTNIFAVRSDPVVQLYNSVPHLTRDDTLRFIAEQQSKYSGHTEITWALLVRELGRVVGDATVFDWDRYHRRALIGYELAQDQWGKGLAHEAIRAILRFAFEQLDLNRVEVCTSAANQRSLRLARRLGFTLDRRSTLGQRTEPSLASA
jgi:ribosomal-protein-alanine N-acetyltransferase